MNEAAEAGERKTDQGTKKEIRKESEKELATSEERLK